MKFPKRGSISWFIGFMGVIVVLLSPWVRSVSKTVKGKLEIGQNLPVHIYRSVQGRPIEVYVFGTGSRSILLIGGIHGDETPGVGLARSLLRYLKSRNRTIAGLKRRIVLIPVANPDGLNVGTRTNARNIDINRNFPTRDFGNEDINGQCNSGETPASEPETSAILQVVNEYQPSLIIAFHAAKGCVNYDGPAEPVAESMAQKNGLPVQSYIGYPTPGSMGTYYGRERHIPVITLELLPGRDQWKRHKKALLSAMGI